MPESFEEERARKESPVRDVPGSFWVLMAMLLLLLLLLIFYFVIVAPRRPTDPVPPVPPCIDYNNDPDNCGTIANVCDFGFICQNGECKCPASEIQVGNTCVNIQYDSQNCGGIGPGFACGLNFECQAGICVCAGTICGLEPFTECVDVQSNPFHCGQCPTVCPVFQDCCNGGCISISGDTQNCGGCGVVCAPGESCCSGGCVDTQDGNPLHCGSCINICGSNQTCCSGICIDLGQTDSQCGSTCTNTVNCLDNIGPETTCCAATCVDILTDGIHCGACNNTCGFGQTCTNGQCITDGSACQPPCSGGTPVCCSGACRSTDNDERNCGACNNDCLPGELCCGGVCIPGSTATDCGACGSLCPTTPTQQCCNGVCSSLLSPTTCNGCQFDCTNAFGPGALCCSTVCVKESITDCGGCGIVCPFNNQMCCNGTCSFVDTDEQNCGCCGESCGPGQICCGGVCVNPQTDSTNCGSCNFECQLGEFCQGGMCGSGTPVCFPGGCQFGETCCPGDDCRNLHFDPLSCGSCFNACGTNQICHNSVCITIKY